MLPLKDMSGLTVSALFYCQLRDVIAKDERMRFGPGFSFAFSEVVILVGLYANGFSATVGDIMKFQGNYDYKKASLQQCLKKLRGYDVIAPSKTKGVWELAEDYQLRTRETIEQVCKEIGCNFNGIIFEVE